MPHTKQQIQKFLTDYQIAPRHRWGQNFLIDLNLMRLLVDTASLTGSETVLEVGCGTGSLTDLLAQHARHVIAVDIDPKIIQIAQQQLAHHNNITFLLTDALKNKNTIEPAVTNTIRPQLAQHPGPFLLIANLPYNIASPLLINLLLETTIPIPDAVLITVQTEVADRILAQPVSKTYGPISIMMQCTGDVSRIRNLGPQSFWPAPKVSSTMLAWRKNPDKLAAIQSLPTLKQTIETLLGRRRKKIRTCLADSIPPDKIDALLSAAAIDPDARAETLPPEKFAALANQIFQSCATTG